MAAITGASYYPETDHDNKYWLETNNRLRAWATWCLFMILRKLSGGWTYIVCGNAQVDGSYKSIYR